MDFPRVIREVVAPLESAGISYALIGGFAMALHGLLRATMDLDFLVMLEDLPAADALLAAKGYQRVFRSENVSHYESPDLQWGRIAILHAFRGPSLGMLKRALRIEVMPGVSVRVARVEDLVGLKVQALKNDPRRADADWADIRLLVAAAGQTGVPLDWELIADYLELFGLGEQLPALKEAHGAPDRP